MDYSDRIHLLLPVAPSQKTPLRLARGLLQNGITATQLAAAAENPCVLAEMAKLIAIYTRPFNPLPTEKAIVPVTVLRGAVHTDIRPCGKLLVYGLTRYTRKDLAGALRTLNIRSTSLATSILENEEVVGTDEAKQYTFFIIPTRPLATVSSFDEITRHRAIIAALKRQYPRFLQENVDASLIVSLLRKKREFVTMAREHRLKWLVLLHKPLIDLGDGLPKLLQLRLTEGDGMKLDTCEVSNDTIWCPDGAFAVLSH